MDESETVSVSKGVFVFKNNFKRSKKSKKTVTSKNASDMFSNNLWYQEYVNLWDTISEDVEKLTSDIFSTMTSDLLDFIKNSHNSDVNEIPTAALLTGINMPDHDAQFKSLENQVKSEISPHVAYLKNEDCSSLKYFIENMINQFINDGIDNSFDEEDDMETDQIKSKIKKSQLNLPLLESWYQNLYPAKSSTAKEERKLLVVIIPEFESFNIKVLQNFILVASSYLNNLPFVIVFGIATSVTTLYTSFPYHVTSKMSTRVFKCDPSTVHLNKLLEDVFLNPFCPFQLGGNVFNLFSDIFLFYDFSVSNFIQNIKYAMIEHFCYGNAMALCNLDKRAVKHILDQFTSEDFENVRHLLSFRKLVECESYENRIALLTDDQYFKQVLSESVIELQKYIRRLHIFLRCLHVLVADLPGFPLGKQLREIYAIAVSENITKTAQYKECFQLLNFQSKDELFIKIEKMCSIISEYINENTKKTQLKDFLMGVSKYTEMLRDFDCSGLQEDDECEEEENEELLTEKMDRKALKEVLFSRSKQKPKPLNRYERLRKTILDYISEAFEIYLLEPKSFYFYEIFFFDDISIQSKIVGTHRSALHNALNDPHFYLQCKCCEIPNSHAIKQTMPDICIAYKLHLECGKMINLYDWLQAFLCILDQNDEDQEDVSKKVVDPELQARFTQCVSELEYLGFIKSSKRKTDHVARLTWGG